jgi:peptidoglycan/xylan/chitin deacetylase (PgdA/CDA1 family)
MALKIKTLAGLVNAALHIKTASGIVPVNLHIKTAGGIELLNGDVGPVYPVAQLLESFDSLTGFSFAAASTQALDTSGQSQGTGRIQLLGNGSNATLFATKTLAGPFVPAELGTIAWLASKTAAQSASISGQLLVLSRGGTSNQVTCMLDSATKSRAGKKMVCAHIAEFPLVAALGSGTLTVSPRFSTLSPYTGDVTIDAMYAQAQGRPTVVITFDDGYNSMYDTVYPIMAARGLVGNYYVPKTSGVDVANRVTSAQIAELYAAGWDMACDSTPNDSNTVLNDTTAAVAAINQNRDWLIARGYTRAKDHFCWTGGLWNEETAAAFKTAGFKSGRTTDPQSFHDRFGVFDLDITIPSQGASSTTALSVHQARIAEIKARGTTQFFHFHDISASPSAIGWQVDKFTSLMDQIKADRDAGLIDVLTLSQWWSRVSRASLPA